MMKDWRKNILRYNIQLGLVLLTYMVLLVGINLIDARFELLDWQRVALSCLPVLPAIALIFVVLRYVRTMDEVWQKIVTESALISAAIVGIGTFTLGFIEEVIDLPGEILIWVWPTMIMTHGIAMCFVRLRYS